MTAQRANPSEDGEGGLRAVPTTSTAKLTIAQAVRDGLAAEMARDERVIVMGEDVGVDGGVFRATDGLIERFGPQRVIDTPLAEDGIVATAIGMAMSGLRPIAEIQFMGFVYPALNQIFAHAARMRVRTRGRFHVPMVIRMPFGGGIHAPESHSESYEALFVHTPGIKVVIPSNPHDTKGLLASAIRDEDPVVFLEPKRIYRAFREAVPTDDYTVPLGRAAVPRAGEDVSLISWGAMVRVCLDAAQELAGDGISAEVVDLRTLNPLDRDALLASVVKTGRAVIVHEAPRTAGFGAEIVALINEHALLHLEAPVQRVTGFDTVFPYARLEKHYLPTRERVVKAVRAILDF
ncbi:MAG: alpha-ketoacid dehydrogenase subunit beta [Acidobacteria bacterium]|jgi:pyruvate dehydrogenase E1 component beta subunit|nr:alpha-ketoacid dehydrogenase subunit beta [Acidobacteriota bacterium]